MKYNLTERPYYVYLPEVIYKPLKEAVAQQEDIELDSAVLIIHNILKRKFQDKNYEDGTEYVTLNSQVVQKYVKDCKKYFDFLKKEGFIHFEKSYSDGKSREYKILDQYFDVAVDITVPDTGIAVHKMLDSRKNDNRKRFERAKQVVAIDRSPELTKWLEGEDNKFSIMKDEAVAFVNEEYPVVLDKMNKDVNKYMRMKRHLTIEKIHSGSFLFSRDGKDDRFHSNFTSMASDIKQFIRYDGIPLKEVDINSSQPVLISIVFKQILNVLSLCYSNLPSKPNRTQQDINIFKRELSKGLRSIINKFTTKEYFNNVIDTTKYIKSITIMLAEHVTTLDNAQFVTFKTDVSEFIKLVRSGKYYELLGEQLLDAGIIQEVIDFTTGEVLYQVMRFNKKLNRPELTKPNTLRKTAKSVMLNTIYMPAHCNKNTAINFFREKNPSIALLLNAMMPNTKSKNRDKSHNRFPILIQQIESKFVLDYCVPKIAKKYPKMSLVTIHDSISTTIDYFDDLKREFDQYLLDYFKFKVKTGCSPWDKKADILLDKIPA